MPGLRSGSDGRRARWDDHRAARREELIAAVIAAVVELGPTVGMEDIARHSGVAKPVFYRYFADKADMHRAVGRSVADHLVRRVTIALDEAPTPRQKLAAGIDAYLGLVEVQPSLYSFVRSAHTPATAGTDLADDYAMVVGVRVTAILGELLRAAGADAGAAEPWGFGLVGMVRAAGDRWLAHPTMPRSALVGYLTDLATAGMASMIPDGASTAAVQGASPEAKSAGDPPGGDPARPVLRSVAAAPRAGRRKGQ